MLKVRKVKVGSLAKIMGVLYGFFGLIMGMFFALIKVLGIEGSPETAQFEAMGLLAIIILPVLYALIGAFSGLLTALFFNLAARLVGPLELEIQEKDN